MPADLLIYDTIPFQYDAPETADADTMLSETEVFGSRSILTPQKEYAPAEMGGGVLVEWAALIIFAAICFSYRYYSNQIGEIVRLIRSSMYFEKVMDEKNRLFNAFINISIGLGLISISLYLYRSLYIKGVVDAQIYKDPMMPAIFLGVVFIVWLYRYVFLKISGWLTESGSFTGRLWYMQKLVFSFYSIVSVPFFLLFILTDGVLYNILNVIYLLIGVAFVVLYLSKSLLFFRNENISIFYWFLYLCGVEILPLSTVVTLVGRLV